MEAPTARGRQSLAALCSGRLRLRGVWRGLRSGRGQAVEFRSSIKPDLGQLPQGHPHFFRFRFAYPLEAFFGHCPIFGGRFHEKAGPPFFCGIRRQFLKPICPRSDSRKQLKVPRSLTAVKGVYPLVLRGRRIAAWLLLCWSCPVSLRAGETMSGTGNQDKSDTFSKVRCTAAMKNADFVWDKGKLDQFIADPNAVVHGNQMKPYGGLASAETRAKVIAYLESVTTGQ